MNEGVAPVILASGSRFRAAMLESAGLAVTVDPPAVDEESVKRSMKAEGADAGTVGEALAATKAQQVSRRHPGSLVIGADQMLECEGQWFDKPAGRDNARGHLQALRGRTHELVTAACVVQDGYVIWHHVARARLTMRPFTDGFIEWYLDAAGNAVCDSVGAYQLEGLGAQLFSRVEGDHFTIIGLPLLPLLDFLRGHGVLPE